MKKIQYLETRYYDDGKAEARLTKHRPVADHDDNAGEYDFYIEEIGRSAENYASLEDWVKDLEIELDDIIPLVLDLEAGKWVDITNYC